MTNRIREYQRAFNTIVSRLRNNDSILAVTVFGSMVTGDIWEDSDIDLFVIVKGSFNDIKDVYGEEDGIPMHLKILSKDSFLNLAKNHIGGSTIHRKFISSKLVVCKDVEISDNFTFVKYYNDYDRDRWTLVYLGKTLKDINACKKYIYNNKIYNVFPIVVNTIESFGKLYLNYNGYLVSKSTTPTLLNLNDEFEILVNKLMNNFNRENIQEVIDYIDNFLEGNIVKCCKLLLEYLDENKGIQSSKEIKYSNRFRGFSIEMEEILGELNKRDIIKMEKRDYYLSNEMIIGEKVYYK